MADVLDVADIIEPILSDIVGDSEKNMSKAVELSGALFGLLIHPNEVCTYYGMKVDLESVRKISLKMLYGVL